MLFSFSCIWSGLTHFHRRAFGGNCSDSWRWESRVLGAFQMRRFRMHRRWSFPSARSFPPTTINWAILVCILHWFSFHRWTTILQRESLTTYKLQLSVLLFSRSKMVDKREVIACHTVGSWKQQLLKGKQSNKLVLVAPNSPISFVFLFLVSLFSSSF